MNSKATANITIRTQRSKVQLPVGEGLRGGLEPRGRIRVDHGGAPVSSTSILVPPLPVLDSKAMSMVSYVQRGLSGLGAVDEVAEGFCTKSTLDCRDSGPLRTRTPMRCSLRTTSSRGKGETSGGLEPLSLWGFNS